MRLVNHPVLCNYYLTYRCNAKCGFCDIWEKPSPYINLNDVEKNLLDLKKLGVRVIDFTGGEPLLHNEIPEILSLAKGMGFITTVTSQVSYTRQDSLRGSISPEREWWDLNYYHLDIAVDPVKKRISGSNTIRYKVLEPAQVLQIDLQSPLRISSLTMFRSPP